MLVPRSLFARTFLLIAALLISSFVALLCVFWLVQLRSRGLQGARQIADLVNLARAALSASEPSTRERVLLTLSTQKGIRVVRAIPPTIRPTLIDADSRSLFTIVLNRISHHLRVELGSDSRIFLQRGIVNRLWISFRLEGDQYWLVLPLIEAQPTFPWSWMVAGGVVLILSMSGAYLIVSHINRPLQTLSQAAEQIGNHDWHSPLPETGASEIAALSRAFNHMVDNLARIDADRSLLLAGVSHDLRTPLSRLRLSMEMLKTDDLKLQREMVRDIEDINAIIDQFLDFSRDESGETIEPVDLNELTMYVVSRFEERGSAIRTDLGDLPAVRLRPMAMQRLITNLLENALRHGESQVEVRTRARDHELVLSFLDRGPGIPESEVSRMLQPFTRLDSSRNAGGGSGLGLAIVSRIARLHGGKIELLPREGDGLDARLTLPLA